MRPHLTHLESFDSQCVQPRLAHVESLGSECAWSREPSFFREDTQHTIGEDAGPQPSGVGAGRMSQDGDPFEGYEDLLEAGIEEWNMDFSAVRASSRATKADADRWPGKDVYWGPDTDAETASASLMSASSASLMSASSCSSRCSVCGCGSVASVSLSSMPSPATRTCPSRCCNSILKSSLSAIPTDADTLSPWLASHLPNNSLSVVFFHEEEALIEQQEEDLKEEDEEEEQDRPITAQSDHVLGSSLARITSWMTDQ